MTLLTAYILAQRRNEDEGGWIQLLVFLVMAVFFIISNLAKARARKREGEKEEEEGLTIEIPPMRRRPIPQPKPPASPQKIFSRKLPQPAAVEIAAAPSVEELPAVKLTQMPETTKHEVEIPHVELIRLEKTDELAKGIIYSEILGKPLALRESWGE